MSRDVDAQINVVWPATFYIPCNVILKSGVGVETTKYSRPNWILIRLIPSIRDMKNKSFGGQMPLKTIRSCQIYIRDIRQLKHSLSV